jgi:protoheme IX farnesyltransferase
MNRAGTTVAAQPALSSPLAVLDFLALAKPRVVLLILVTTFAGFAMASVGPLDFALLARTLIGTALVAGGTLALNQYMERDVDAHMRRTHKRPLPGGRMPPVEALAFGSALTCAGLLYLTFGVNPVSGMVTALTVLSYLFVYTPLKTRTALCTVAGAFPGALPPITGWTAAGGQLDIGAAVLFGILFFWQLPHSLAIAHLYREDYDRAGVRLLPTVDPAGGSTGRHTVVNCMALLSVGLLPTLVGMAGWAYFFCALALGCWMLRFGISLALSGDAACARRLLLATYLYIPVVLLVMVADKR